MSKHLPAGASLEHLKKQAKDLQAAAVRGDADAIARLALHTSAADRGRMLQLSQAQHVIAQEHRFASWPKLKHHVEAVQAARRRVGETKQRVRQRARDNLEQRGSLFDRPMSDAAVAERLEQSVPLLPVRNAVLFPGACGPFLVARPRTLALVDALTGQRDGLLAVFCQHSAAVDDPDRADLQAVGVLARVYDVVPIPGEPTTLFLEGLRRVRLEEVTQRDPYLQARCTSSDEGDEDAAPVAALADELRRYARRVVALVPELPQDTLDMLDQVAGPGELADMIAQNLDIPPNIKGALLAAESLPTRLRKLIDVLCAQLGLLECRERVLAG